MTFIQSKRVGLGPGENFEAFMMVDEVIGNVKSTRKTLTATFKILDLAEKLGIIEAIPRKTNETFVATAQPWTHA